MAVTTRIYPAGRIRARDLTYVVIGARYLDDWIFVRHRERETWEMPAGHIEGGETPDQAAVRELFEETGAVRSTIHHICDYSVTIGAETEFGRLYGAIVHELETILEYEIDEICFDQDLPESLTYPEVQPVLFAHAKDHRRQHP